MILSLNSTFKNIKLARAVNVEPSGNYALKI